LKKNPLCASPKNEFCEKKLAKMKEGDKSKEDEQSDDKDEASLMLFLTS
jgi:hypothetical protein